MALSRGLVVAAGHMFQAMPTSRKTALKSALGLSAEKIIFTEHSFLIVVCSYIYIYICRYGGAHVALTGFHAVSNLA